jgi:fucose 4-O-acetylase-like acetyltransferase
VSRLKEMAERTPARRERHVDLLRAVAIIAVVIGHWLVIVVEPTDDGVEGYSALAALTWAHPLTWLFQVMPVFFIVGGYANAASLVAHRRDGGAAAGWLLDRSARLVPPTAVLLVVLGGGAVVARAGGVDPDLIGTAVWLASLPLWFLVVYLAMVFLTPVMHALHSRAGLAVPVLLLLPVVVGDVWRIQVGDETLAYGNFLFAWLAIHQIGFCWQDGRLPTGPRVSVPLLAGGLAALVLLTVVGPYPVSMVTVPGAEIQNPSPPTLALVALATAQLGLALLLRKPSDRWLQRTRPWTVVVGLNSVILTLFLWHMGAAVLATAGLHLAGLLPAPPVGSATWLWWQIPWIAILAVALVALVAIFGRVETRAAQPPRVRITLPALAAAAARTGPLTMVVTVGYLATLLGLLWQAVAGEADHGAFGLPTGSLALFLAGAAMLWSARIARAGRPADGTTHASGPADGTTHAGHKPRGAHGRPQLDSGWRRHR